MGISFSRRRWLRSCGLNVLGLSLLDYFGLRGRAAQEGAAGAGFGRARACIVLYCWGGTSHLDTWDPKPEAAAEVRGEFRPIGTAVPGIRISEHLPRLARQMKRMAIVRSVHHNCTAHGKSMYWNLTGHAPPEPEAATNIPPSINDWPSLGAQVAHQRRGPWGLPAAAQIPYPLVDNNTLQAGDGPGWLGQSCAPLLVRPNRGTPYAGVSRELGALLFRPAEAIDTARLQARAHLSRQLADLPGDVGQVFNLPGKQRQVENLPHGPGTFGHNWERAFQLLCDPKVQQTLDLDREPSRLRDRYGEHLCGQSLLLARRLVEAHVPLVTVICAAGDLNGGGGDHWDTHGDNFPRLKNRLLPPLDQASAALLDDLDDRGLLEQTLVVWLTEFGRSPRMTGTGRNHYPFCYSVAFAGGGIRGGQVYGRSDAQGSRPRDLPCGPNDLHATILHALGIPLDATLIDAQGRPLPIGDGRPLPLFA
jgi:hypothetical protein